MKKTILNLTQISEFVFSNKYQVEETEIRKTRCIDGRYLGQDLPAFAYPGADAGMLATVFATARTNGYDLDQEKAYSVISDLVGGEKNLQFHSDSHAHGDLALTGCGHIKQMTLSPEAYDLTTDEVEFIKNKFTQAKKKEAHEIILQGDHQEGAVVFINGNWGIYPQGEVTMEIGEKQPAQIFIYHKTLASEYFRILTKELIAKKAIIFKDSETEEMLLTALLEVADIHLLETAKRLAKGLPIFDVKFEEDGQFKIEEMGSV